MSDVKKCPQDGGFIGDNACPHRNHEHSELVEKLTKERTPHEITPQECDMALTEGFYVNTQDGTKVGFGKKLATHIEHHSPADQRRRKIRLMYAIKTVKGGKKRPNPQGGAGSYAYAKEFDGFGMLVLTDTNGNVEDVFDIIPRKRR